MSPLNFLCCFFIVFCLSSTSYGQTSCLTSDFTNTTDGWTASKGAWVLSSGSGINGTTNTSNNWYFFAPSKYLGNQSWAQALRFVLTVNAQTIDFVRTDDVIVRGMRKELYTSLSSIVTPFTATTIGLFFTGSTTWYVRNIGSSNTTGQPIANANDTAAVLQYVTGILVRGRYSYSMHSTMLSQIRLCDGPDSVANAFCSNSCSGHGQCLRGNCSCMYGWTGVDCSMKLKGAVSRFAIPATTQNSLMTPLTSVTGKVNNVQNAAQANASVVLSVYGYSSVLATTFTDSKGMFSFSVRIPSGFYTYLLTASYQGLSTSSQLVLSPGQQSASVLTLPGAKPVGVADTSSEEGGFAYLVKTKN